MATHERFREFMRIIFAKKSELLSLEHLLLHRNTGVRSYNNMLIFQPIIRYVCFVWLQPKQKVRIFTVLLLDCTRVRWKQSRFSCLWIKSNIKLNQVFEFDKNLQFISKIQNDFIGGAGYRSRYLSHAKRALYHLSYAPLLENIVT